MLLAETGRSAICDRGRRLGLARFKNHVPRIEIQLEKNYGHSLSQSLSLRSLTKGRATRDVTNNMHEPQGVAEVPHGVL